MAAPARVPASLRRALERLFVHVDKSGIRRVGTNLSTANPPPLAVVHQLARKGLVTYEETDVFRIFGARGWHFELTEAGREALEVSS